jgi:DNA-binding LacI/PurR family transcriptional regulator|tara:strand:- start:735 stop:962 length:228 start_codon:yes stop_codon:yes gene_type:complete
MLGYQTGVPNQGITPYISHGRATQVYGRDVGFELLKNNPKVKTTACLNDLVVLGMMSALIQSGVRVGQDFPCGLG